MLSHSPTADCLRAATLLCWTFLILLVLAALMPPDRSTASGQALATGLPYAAVRAIEHRGDAEPARDSEDKWFISVITMHNCGACERLKHDFAHADDLAALVNVNDRAQSWSHYNVFQWEDASNSWRWKDIHVTAFPAILIQPPLSGEYGDPRTLVWQKVGYDGNDHQLAQEIRGAIGSYVAEVSADERARSSLAALPNRRQTDPRQTLRRGELGRELSR